QLERACLEDIVMAKLHGLTMGLDVCATFHMAIPPAVLREINRRIVDRGAPAYLMAVAGNADPMLGYLTTSFREHPPLRQLSGREITTAMQARLAALDARSTPDLYAAYMKTGGDDRTIDALRTEGAARIERLRQNGWDLGSGEASGSRVDAIYAQARRALYAVIDANVVAAVSPRHVRARNPAAHREPARARTHSH